MSNLSLIEAKEKIVRKDGISFEWRDSLPVQRLLDVISCILVEEYVVVAKENPEVFSVCTPLPIPPHKGGGNLGMEKENGGEK